MLSESVVSVFMPAGKNTRVSTASQPARAENVLMLTFKLKNNLLWVLLSFYPKLYLDPNYGCDQVSKKESLAYQSQLFKLLKFYYDAVLVLLRHLLDA